MAHKQLAKPRSDDRLGYAFPGDPMEREKKNPVAQLSPLGKKLLGLEKW